MSLPIHKDIVRLAFLEASFKELVSLKPGNVHIHAPGHGMQVGQFEASAKAAAPFLADPSLGVGGRVRQAVEASFEAAGCNTNLGILLLCAPLAKAAESPSPRERGEGRGEGPKLAGNLDLAPDPSPLPVNGRGEGTPSNPCRQDLRSRLSRVLKSLTVRDADEVYKAIARANPGGLGSVKEQDVRLRPSVTLLEAMALASARDRIALAYVQDYEDVFVTGLPALEAARQGAASSELAVTTLHMTYLAAFEDSHIARKHGDEAAVRVRRQAQALARFWKPFAKADSLRPLLDFDADLKERGLNPGTTADFVVATLFAETLSNAIAGADRTD